jgi:hypothetical protein
MMRTAIPTELLLRLLNATTEQYAAVERILGANADSEAAADVEPVGEDLAVRLFGLVNALESETNYRKAPVIRVFYLYCVKTLTRAEVARACRCVPSLVSLRLRTIEKKLGRKPKELRCFSSEFERISDSLSDSRARRIDRQRAMDNDDPESDE